MTPVTTDRAATEVGVKPATVRQWAARGLLKPLGRVAGRPVYDLDDVFRAEARTAATRRSAVTR